MHGSGSFRVSELSVVEAPLKTIHGVDTGMRWRASRAKGHAAFGCDVGEWRTIEWSRWKWSLVGCQCVNI